MTTAAVGETQVQSGSFIRSRLGSILAVLPLGVWTLNHLWDNLAAFSGAAAWEEAVTHHAHPLSQFVVSVLVLVPLLWHTVWGLWRMSTMAKPNIVNYTFFGNLRFWLQRASALGLLGFLGAHLWLAMLKPRLFGNGPEAFKDITHEMHHHGPTLVVYLLGTLAVSYHLANGLSTVSMGLGLVGTRRALKKVEYVTYGLFVVFLAVSWAAIYALWSAGA